jgi:hypothetical protein
MAFWNYVLFYYEKQFYDIPVQGKAKTEQSNDSERSNTMGKIE